MTKQRNSNAFLRTLISGLIFLLASGMIVFALVTLIAKRAVSKPMIQKVYSQADLYEEYGDAVTDILNVGIMHLTDSAYTDHLYLTKDQLPQFFNKQEVRDFIVDKLSETARVLYTDEQEKVVLEAREITPFLNPVVDHIEKETGKRVTEQEVTAEVSKAIGGDIQTTLPDLRILYPGRSTVILIAGIVLFAAAFLVNALNHSHWNDMVRGCIFAMIGIVIISGILFVISRIAGSIADINAFTDMIGEGYAAIWIREVQKLFTRRSLLALLTILIPLALLIIFIADKKHVNRILQSRGNNYGKE